MVPKYLQSILIIICCVVLSTICSYYTVRIQSRKIAVVDAIRLFDEFNMKKELEALAKRHLESESRELDSIGNILQLARAENSQEKFNNILNNYRLMKGKIDSDYTMGNRQINEQVWKRLNALLDEYGKTEKFHLIIGANGMGSVLYNDDYYDRTNEAIKFVNRKYAEGN